MVLGSDPVAYARLLLDLTRRPGRLAPIDLISPTRPGWLPFLDRRTVSVRINRLLEDDMSSTLSRPSAGSSLLIGGLAVAAALVIGGLRIHAASAPPTTPPRAEAPALPAPEKALDEIRGVVLDPKGKPVAGATVVAASYEGHGKDRQTLTADAQGRFAWRLPPRTNLVYLLAHKEGFATAFGLVDPSREPTASDGVQLRLARPSSFSAVLVGDAGNPIADAMVRMEMIAHSFEQGNRGGHVLVRLWPIRIL